MASEVFWHQAARVIHEQRLSFARTTLLLTLLVWEPFGFSAQIDLPTQIAVAGTAIFVQIAFAPQTSSVSGVQFDVQYDNSAISLDATPGGAAKTSGKSLYAVDLAPDKKRFLIIGQNQAPIPGGTLINLSINVRSGAPGGVYSLALSNVYGTNPSGYSVAVDGSNGTLTVTSGSPAKLQPSGVLNAASFLPGPVVPGELVTLIGTAIGPASAQYPTGSASDTVLGGTSVLFDGVAAPLLYAAPNQINAVVPYGVFGETVTQLTVAALGQTIAAVAPAVATASPAIFTLDSSGIGPGAVLNQDSSINSASNPAPKGSVISIFATGAGQMNPPGVDGQVPAAILSKPVLSVSVQIGGLDAQILYAGAAPGLISGALQVNALIPSASPSGATVPLTLIVGRASSQTRVTIAIR